VLVKVLAVFGAIVAALKVIDLLLNEHQKAKLNDLSLKAWSWLDDRRRNSLRQHFKLPSSRMIVGATLSGTSWSITNFLSDTTTRQFGGLAGAISIGAVFLVSADKVLWPFIDRASSGANLVLRLAGVFLAYELLAVILVLVFDYLSDSQPEFWIVHSPLHAVVVANVLITGALLLNICIGPLLAVIGRPILWGAEFLVRKIAENQKGPVIALSALMEGLAALIAHL
jgi:hypothetical protein